MERWKRPHYRSGDSVNAAALAGNGRHPSFSSSLLDAIDRSIDKSAVSGGRREGRCAEADMKKHDHGGNYSHLEVFGRGEDDRYFMATGQKHSTTVTDKVALHRRGTVEYDPPQQHYRRTQPQKQRERFFGNSTSSSSESSYGGFSSSEAESVVLSAPPLPKPVRTTGPPERKPERMPMDENNQQKVKGSIRSSFRVSKLYSELKKERTSPVSPGARLASFLNTLFSTAGNPKKPKISTAVNAAGGGRGGDESACSSASSYSRSCLSKTPSSRGKTATPSSGGGTSKRSVRFYPVSVIVDEDCRPCGQKCVYEEAKPDYFLSEPPLTALRVMEEPPPRYYPAAAAAAEEEVRKRAMEAARGLVAYKEKTRGLEGFEIDEEDDEEEEEEEDDDDDDAASYSSSDLFELKDLAAIGGGGEVRYRDELPVYGTTHLDANCAIARGLTV